jgi:hypothetical protein
MELSASVRGHFVVPSRSTKNDLTSQPKINQPAMKKKSSSMTARVAIGALFLISSVVQQLRYLAREIKISAALIALPNLRCQPLAERSNRNVDKAFPPFRHDS